MHTRRPGRTAFRPSFHVRFARAALCATALLPALSCPQAHAQPASVAGTVFEVRRGDSFSVIAGRVTGNPLRWRDLYHRQLSNLPNPDLIQLGARLELVQAPDGSRYLRVMKPGDAAVASAVRAPAQASAPVAPAPASAPGPLPATLTIGVLPNIAPAQLLAQYEPLKRYLERLNGGQQVRIATAPNFRAFFDSTLQGEYDVAITAPHFARVTQAEGKLAPLVILEPRIRALFIAPAERPLASVKDLRGKSLVFANPQSLVAMYGQQWMRQNDLLAGKDFEIKAVRSDLGVGRMLLAGEAAAAVMSMGEFRALPKEESDRLKVVEEFAQIPNFVVMTHPRLNREFTERLRGQFKAAPADAQDGATYAKSAGVTRIVDADEGQLKELDAYVEPVRKAMGLSR